MVILLYIWDDHMTMLKSRKSLRKMVHFNNFTFILHLLPMIKMKIKTAFLK